MPALKLLYPPPLILSYFDTGVVISEGVFMPVYPFKAGVLPIGTILAVLIMTVSMAPSLDICDILPWNLVLKSILYILLPLGIMINSSTKIR